MIKYFFKIILLVFILSPFMANKSRETNRKIKRLNYTQWTEYIALINHLNSPLY